MSDLIEPFIAFVEKHHHWIDDRTVDRLDYTGINLGHFRRAVERIRELEAAIEEPNAVVAEAIQRAEKAEAERDALQEHLADLPKGFREWNAQIDAIEVATIERCAQVIEDDQRNLWTRQDMALAIRALKPSGEKPVNPYLLGGSSTQSEG